MGLSLREGGLHDGFGGFDGLAVLESTSLSFCFSYKTKDRETAATVLTILGCRQ